MERERQGVRRVTRRQRALRGTASSAVAVTVAATAHTLAGGGAPAWWLLLAVTLLASPIAVVLVGRRPSLRGTVAAAMVSQAALHAAFAAVGTGGASVTTTPHHALPALSPVSVSHLHLDAPMIVAHVLAAAATVLLLQYGERALRRIARGIRRLLTRALPTLDIPVARAARSTPAGALPRPVFLSALSRRGPPALAR